MAKRTDEDRNYLKKIRIGTWNVQTLRNDRKVQDLVDDIQNKRLSITAIQETHYKGTGTEILTTSTGKKYTFYYSGDENSRGGVGFIVQEGLKVEYKPLSDRTSKIDALLGDGRKLTVLCTYAPTNPQCEKNPTLRDQYYEELDSIIATIPSRSVLVIAGDFNAKTGSGHRQYPENIGKFGKGHMNENGEALLDLANHHNLVLTNTKFPHKLLHRTTWESPFRSYTMKNGEERRNPQRNQIDYILVRRQNMKQVNDCRSYPHDNKLTSDHRPVIMDINLAIRIYKSKNPGKNIDFESLRHQPTRQNYSAEVDKIMQMRSQEDNTPQERWDKIVSANKTAAEKVLGYKTNTKKSKNEQIKKLSEEQKQLNNKLNTAKDPAERGEIRRARNTKLNKIHEILEEEKHMKIVEQIEEIEKSAEDSYRMFKAVKILANNEKRKPLLIQGQDGMTTDQKDQANIIARHFENIFTEENLKEIKKIPPAPIEPPFTIEEIQKAIKSLKNNRSPGDDEIRAEQLKYGGKTIPQEITNILNEVSRTGKYPTELKEGILTPLQKPGKKQGPLTNLRPIILLSMLRKILAICLIRRIGRKIDENIPIEQAAYRSGRGTTEHTFAYKLLAEKAITSQNYQVNVTLMDMSKAFDTVRRSSLIEDLTTILDPAELHLIKILTEDVKLKVRVGTAKSDAFTTKMGVPQGDCLSPILFTLYLAKTLENKNQRDHNYAKTIEEGHTTEDLPSELQDHNYAVMPKYGTIVRPQYADDIGWCASNNKYGIEKEKKTALPKLKNRGLRINEDKTEEFEITRNGNDSWKKKCKILGSLIDTNEDIKRRKTLTINSMNKLQYIFSNSKLKTTLKIRIFRACCESIFLFNSEIWTLNKTSENKIDSFHRRLLRKALNIKWPRKIASEELYRITKQDKWSDIIRKRRVKWYGHVIRMPDETPAKVALQEAQRRVKKPRGGQTTTWLATIQKDLQKQNLTLEDANTLALDRTEWRRVSRMSGAPCAQAPSAS